MRATRRVLMFLGTMFLITISSHPASQAVSQPVLPNPVLYMVSMEFYSTGGVNFVRYKYDVLNKDAYPTDMFAPAPGLPPCGKNTNSSRTWVDIFDSRGKRPYGFCALGKPADLNGIWFSTPEGEVPPSYIYIEMNDRQTNTKYKSNLADTVM